MLINEITGEEGYLIILIYGFNFNEVRKEYLLARKLIGTTSSQRRRLSKNEIEKRLKRINEIENDIEICANLEILPSINRQEYNEDLVVMNIKLWGIDHLSKLKLAKQKAQL